MSSTRQRGPVPLPAMSASLDEHVATLAVRLPHAGIEEIVAALGEVRALADAQGLRPAGTVAHLIALAATAGVGRGMVAQWLPVLRDAAASGRRDAAAADCYAAACAIRQVR